MTKMNMSTIHDTQMNASVMFKTMSGSTIDQYNVTRSNESAYYSRQPVASQEDTISSSETPVSSLTSVQSGPASGSFDEDYRKWTKLDLIDDLIYYRERERELVASVLAMKNAWKDDEKLMNEERMDFEIQKNNWKVDLHNERARLRNEYNSSTEKLFGEMKLLKKSLKESKEQVAQLVAARDEAKIELEEKLKAVETISAENEELRSEMKVLNMKNQNLEAAAKEHDSKLEKQLAENRKLRSSIAQLELKLAEKEDELLTVKTTRMSIDPLDSNDTIDFANFNPPKARSSILPVASSTRTQLNSTEDLMSNIMEDMSKTPEALQSFSEKPNSDDKVDLYRQIQNLNRQLREAKKEATESAEQKQSNHNEALLHQIKEAANKEAELNSKINALELEKEVLKKRSDRCLLRKEKETLERDNEVLQSKVSKLENLLASGNIENLVAPPSTPSKKFKNKADNLDPVVEELEKPKRATTRSQRRLSDSTNQIAPKRNLRSRK